MLRFIEPNFAIMVAATSLTTLLLVLVVTANPITNREESFVRLPITRRVKAGTVNNIVQQDQLRAMTLKGKAEAILSDVEVSSQVENQVVSYIASVGVGSPATQCKQLVAD